MQSLDTEQLKAIRSEESCAVIAGPGSGKTKTLVAKALREAGPKTIALTFTRNAVAEIQNRSPTTRACTIHSLCYQYLNYYPGNYDELLRQFILLRRKPKFDWVLVDEFQDLNPPELQVVLSILNADSASHQIIGRLFLVGDPCQSIFGYQESLGNKVLQLTENNLKLKRFPLNNNYRSNQNIIDQLERIHLRQLHMPHTKTHSKIKGTAILFRTNKQLDAVSQTLTEMEIDHNIRKRGFKFPGEANPPHLNNHHKEPLPLLSTIHCTKGLEFQKVMAFNWGERYMERNLYYVAIARASEEFYLIDSLTQLLTHLQEN